jgi:hypothetical protein
MGAWMTARPLLLISISLLCGCATVVSSTSSTVREATAQQVASCSLIKSISATSPFYGVFAGKAMQETRDKIIAEAEAANATHIVFTQSETAYGGTSQHAQAFSCK